MVVKNRRWRFHGLKKPKIRQDWNKYNLYNLSRLSAPNTASRTYFQQKWTAKASTRAYHGEQIKEKQWQRMFDRRTPAVVPMDPKALAEDDGSKYSVGRGSGKELPPGQKVRLADQVPYMQMVYHPTERRLDTAVFRALFASSARQARQYVVHGHVKVNGKRMIYPGYMLNPGDLFQVDPEAVLQCTGTLESRWSFKTETVPPSKKFLANQRRLKRKEAREGAAAAGAEPEEESATEVEEDDDGLSAEEELTEEEAAVDDSDPAAASKKRLLALRSEAIDLEKNPPKGKKLIAKQRQEMRAFRKTLKSSISRAKSIETSAVDELDIQWQSMSTKIRGAKGDAPTSSEDAVRADEADPGPSSPPPMGSTGSGQTSMTLPNGEPIPTGPDGRQIRTGPDWTPKRYMSAFAFVPRYLEVNQSIFAAVYLRHPVCKPGFAEVPTPFHPETGQLTFNWYLRRR